MLTTLNSNHPMIGTRLGAYRITALLGAGAMGEVYRAHDERLRREVAVKILPKDVSENAERLARFDREARTPANLCREFNQYTVKVRTGRERQLSPN